MTSSNPDAPMPPAAAGSPGVPAQVVLLPHETIDGVGVYPEWTLMLFKELREGGVPVAWAADQRSYRHAFSEELVAAGAILLWLADHISGEMISILVDRVRGMARPGEVTHAVVQPVKVALARSYDPETGRLVGERAEMEIGGVERVDVVAAIHAFTSGATNWSRVGHE